MGVEPSTLQSWPSLKRRSKPLGLAADTCALRKQVFNSLKVFLRHELFNYSLYLDFTFANVAKDILSLSAQLFCASNDFKLNQSYLYAVGHFSCFFGQNVKLN